jgi:exosortase A-associated hydrolase 2
MSTAVRAFFLAIPGGGQRYCVYHPAAGHRRGALLFVPPFGDEMNKARRMMALQARTLAQAGFDILQIDLDGCGDSSGEAADARWESWRTDLALGRRWLAQRSGHIPALLALRLGALLALDFADRDGDVRQVVLWQPVLDGAAFVNQLYRQHLASAMLTTESVTDSGGIAGLRARHAQGQCIEIGGYALAPQLARACAGLRLETLARPDIALHWCDIGPPGRATAPVIAALLQRWRDAGQPLQFSVIDGPAFWETAEISICTPLLQATLALCLAFQREPDHVL